MVADWHWAWYLTSLNLSLIYNMEITGPNLQEDWRALGRMELRHLELHLKHGKGLINGSFYQRSVTLIDFKYLKLR